MNFLRKSLGEPCEQQPKKERLFSSPEIMLTQPGKSRSDLGKINQRACSTCTKKKSGWSKNAFEQFLSKISDMRYLGIRCGDILSLWSETTYSAVRMDLFNQQ